VDIIRRAVRRSSLPVSYSRGFHPQSRISVSPPLAVGMEGEKEFFDMKLREPADFGPGIFDGFLPAGITVKSCLGPFSGSRGKLPPEALFHYSLDFSLIRLIIESERDISGPDPEKNKYLLLGRALGLKDGEDQLKELSDPASRLRDRMKVLFDRGGSITDRRGRERPVEGCRTGELDGDLLELYLRMENGAGVTPRDLLNIYLPGELIPLVRINREGMYYKRGGEYLDPAELVG
jgi:hypothetical protein